MTTAGTRRKNSVLMPAIVVIAMALLTGCDYFADNWEAEGGRCQSLSDDGNYTVMVSHEGIGFLERKSGCPANLDIVGSRYTTIQVNGEPYRAMLMCNAATRGHTITTVGLPTEKGENAILAASARAVEAFTAFSGARVVVEGQKIHFAKGNFGKVCPDYLPRTGNGKTGGIGAPTITFGDLTGKQSPPSAPVLAPLTPDIHAQSLEAAKKSYRSNTSGYGIDRMHWVETSQPERTQNGVDLRVLRYSALMEGRVHEIDVFIRLDGSISYTFYDNHAATHDENLTLPAPEPEPGSASALSRNLPVTAMKGPADSAQQPVTTALPVNAFCTLDNGKSVGVFAAAGQDYRYTYTDKNDKPELELREGLFGVKAFHYHSQMGMGSASYIRFSKGPFDYVLLSKDTGHEEFYGIRVYKNGDRIASHECKTRLTLNTEALPDDHTDSDKLGEYFTR
ncbi:TPA: hypothetical protein R4S64_003728 [Kluyvera georgiana]|nr:hypothetical protein [Kluyvera georgiana]